MPPVPPARPGQSAARPSVKSPGKNRRRAMTTSPKKCTTECGGEKYAVAREARTERPWQMKNPSGHTENRTFTRATLPTTAWTWAAKAQQSLMDYAIRFCYAIMQEEGSDNFPKLNRTYI